MTTADGDIGKMQTDAMLRGWKEIANYLEISVLAAQERAKRIRDPLPVGKDHRGPFAYVTALRDWVSRSRRAYQDDLELRRRTASDHAKACDKAAIAFETRRGRHAT